MSKKQKKLEDVFPTCSGPFHVIRPGAAICACGETDGSGKGMVAFSGAAVDRAINEGDK